VGNRNCGNGELGAGAHRNRRRRQAADAEAGDGCDSSAKERCEENGKLKH
jgi:hypothetical protein